MIAVHEKVDITLTAREILEKKIDEAIEKYPETLKAKHAEKIMNCTQPQLNILLNDGEIPGAKKLPGLGWRIPRETFFAWWYGKEENE